MNTLLMLAITVTGLVTAVLTPDPFGWRFNASLAAILGGIPSLVVRAAFRFRKSPRRWLRRSGTILLLILGSLAIAWGVVWSDYHLVIFRRASVESWRADILDLRAAIDKLPPGLRERAHRRMTPELDALAHDLPALTNDERHARVIRAVASLGDGHSIDFPFFPVADFCPVPLQIQSFDDGWFVVRAPAAQSELVGLRVAAIAGLNVETAYQAIRPYVAADNEYLSRERARCICCRPGSGRPSENARRPGPWTSIWYRAAASADRSA